MIGSNKLPPGWVEGFDTNYNRPYYFHKPTRRSSWTRPDFKEVIEEEEEDPSTFKKSQAVNVSNNLHSSFEGSPQKQQKAVSKFNDWLEVYSPEYQRTFYFNKITRESVWTDPRTKLGYNEKLAEGESKPALIVNEKSPAGFISVWETVGERPSKDAPQVTPIIQQSVKSVMPQAVASAAPPTFTPSSVQSSPIRVNSSLNQSSQMLSPEDKLGEELKNYARDLHNQESVIERHANVLDSNGRVQLNSLNDEVNELYRTAERLANSKDGSQRRTMKRQFSDASALASWGSEPPRIIEVKRAMADIANGIKYAKEELKAQSKAKAEAEKVDSEGGYYTILGVSPDSDLETMKKAYRKAMIKTHPDKVAPEEKERAMEKANMLQNAFNCLSDPWERYLYDYFGLQKYLQTTKVVQCFKNYLLSGTEIIKHPRKGYPRRRFLWISPDNEYLNTGRERNLEPTPDELEEIKGVRIKDIHEITRGIATEVFERTGKPKKQSRYFSIITNERTLDIEAETKERADFLVSRISLLVLDVQKNKKWLLRHFELKALKEAAQTAQAAKKGETRPPPNGPEGQNTSKEENAKG